MGVYIPGMEMPTMPKNLMQGEAVPYIDVRIFANGNAVTSKGERPYYTEYHAVPVPEHGRLIDADAPMRLEIKIDGGMNMCVTDIYAPTIIPADKDGEE